jgi:phosphoenolpyruvate carboxylase
LLLPAWLGAGQALAEAIKDSNHQSVIQQMIADWPFFRTRISMLEMVFAKSDLLIAEYYDDTLVSTDYLPLGIALRQQLQQDATTVLDLLNQDQLLQHDEWGKESIRLRNIYTAPLNLLQAELLRRERNQNDTLVEQAIMVSIAGVAAGMRNTG